MVSAPLLNSEYRHSSEYFAMGLYLLRSESECSGKTTVGPQATAGVSPLCGARLLRCASSHRPVAAVSPLTGCHPSHNTARRAVLAVGRVRRTVEDCQGLPPGPSRIRSIASGSTIAHLAMQRTVGYRMVRSPHCARACYVFQGLVAQHPPLLDRPDTVAVSTPESLPIAP